MVFLTFQYGGIMKKIILSVAFLAFSMASPYALSAEHEKNTTAEKEVSFTETITITKRKYHVSGYVSVLGFGAGHAIQGRWTEAGLIFVGSAILTLSPIIYYSLEEYQDLSETTRRIITVSRWSLLLALKVWEVASAWRLPPNYKVVKAPKFSVSPVYIARYKDTHTAGLGLSFKYRF